MTLKVLELFGGIGAPRSALERLGVDFEIVDYVEIDKFAVNSYNAIYDSNYEPQDISEWDKDVEVDIVFHGSPCQDFSLAGQNAGGDKGSGTRSSLMWHTVRIVEKYKPKVVVWENVKNVLSKKHRPTFDQYINKMSDLGYSTYHDVLKSSNYGIPQKRERVFSISILGQHNMYQFPQPIELEVFLKDLLEDEVDEKYFLSEKMYNYLTDNDNKFKRGDRFKPIDADCERIANTVTTSGGNRVTDNFIMVKNATKKGYLEARDGDGVDLAYPNSKERRGRVQVGMSQTITTSANIGVVVKSLKEEYCDMLIQKELVDEYDVIDHSFTNNRMSTERIKKLGNNIVPTMTTRPDTLGITVLDHEYLRIRKLTPLECWRLMGFTDGQFHRAESVCSNAQLYKQAGNSIVVDTLVHLLEPLIPILHDMIVDEFLFLD